MVEAEAEVAGPEVEEDEEEDVKRLAIAWDMRDVAAETSEGALVTAAEDAGAVAEPPAKRDPNADAASNMARAESEAAPVPAPPAAERGGMVGRPGFVGGGKEVEAEDEEVPLGKGSGLPVAWANRARSFSLSRSNTEPEPEPEPDPDAAAPEPGVAAAAAAAAAATFSGRGAMVIFSPSSWARRTAVRLFQLPAVCTPSPPSARLSTCL